MDVDECFVQYLLNLFLYNVIQGEALIALKKMLKTIIDAK